MQVSTASQTELRGNKELHFNKIYRKQLTECLSFFTCNTLSDDDSFLTIERSTQTYESGGQTTESESQTIYENIFRTVITDSILSVTTENTEDDSSSKSDSENSQSCSVMTCNSYSNTIITFTE